MTDRDDIVERLTELAAEEEAAAELTEVGAATAHPGLYDRVGEVFDTWEEALVAALVEAVRAGDRRGGGRRAPSQVERRVTEDATDPIYVSTEGGAFFSMGADQIALAPELGTFAGLDTVGAPTHVEHIGEPEDVYLFSDAGHFFGMDARLVPRWQAGDALPSTDIGARVHLEEGERVVSALPRRSMYGGRLIHVSTQGKSKATDAEEIRKYFDKEPREAFLLGEEGDYPVGIFTAPEEATVFCASAMGRAIQFPSEELRSMGRRAVGVNAMKLEDEGDAIVSAFSGQRRQQIAVITELGYAKRVDFEEFRSQGRAGAGLQLLRLGTHDRVAAVAPCDPARDLLVMTDAGRIARLPATHLSLMGRPARGDQIVELEDDEHVIAMSLLPCAGPIEG